MSISAHLRRMLLTGSLILFAVPAAAEPAGSTRQSDPDEMICERHKVLGSRLAKKKVCMTRAQWEDKRRSERDVIDRSQVNGCLREAGC
jgi:hypothetical protein